MLVTKGAGGDGFCCFRCPGRVYHGKVNAHCWIFLFFYDTIYGYTYALHVDGGFRSFKLATRCDTPKLGFNEQD